jgi:hypothetical protein
MVKEIYDRPVAGVVSGREGGAQASAVGARANSSDRPNRPNALVVLARVEK